MINMGDLISNSIRRIRSDGTLIPTILHGGFSAATASWLDSALPAAIELKARKAGFAVPSQLEPCLQIVTLSKLPPTHLVESVGRRVGLSRTNMVWLKAVYS